MEKDLKQENSPGIGILHPETNPPAIARTSEGARAISNDCGMALPRLRTLRMVWWRASTVKIEAAASKSSGSLISVAPPRYAPTPTFSTTRAVAAMVATSVKTDEKSKLHPVMGAPPIAARAS